jgi:hypothetical protein
VRACTVLPLFVAMGRVARDMGGQCVGSAGKAVGVVRSIDDAPEAIRDGDKDADD